MDTNENMRNHTTDEVIELGVASVETKGSGPGITEGSGHGFPIVPGISEE